MAISYFKNQMSYPPRSKTGEEFLGLVPVDFVLEAVIKAGIEWFINTPGAGHKVFGNLNLSYLKAKYGDKKIADIENYIKKYEINIIQSFPLSHTKTPCISILYTDSSESLDKAGLADFKEELSVFDEVTGDFVERTDYGYTPITDGIHIGIHSIESPDLVKYLYYLVTYILNVFKMDLEDQNINLTTLRANDLSRLNEYLPENMFSRFLSFNALTYAAYDRGTITAIKQFVFNPDVVIIPSPITTLPPVEVSGSQGASGSGLPATTPVVPSPPPSDPSYNTGVDGEIVILNDNEVNLPSLETKKQQDN